MVLRSGICDDDLAFDDCAAPESTAGTSPIRCDPDEHRGSGMNLAGAQVLQEFDFDWALVSERRRGCAVANCREEKTKRERD